MANTKLITYIATTIGIIGVSQAIKEGGKIFDGVPDDDSKIDPALRPRSPYYDEKVRTNLEELTPSE